MQTNSGHELGPAGRNILAVLTEDFSQLSSAYQPNSVDKPSPADEYVSGIELPTTSHSCLDIYQTNSTSTFSINA